MKVMIHTLVLLAVCIAAAVGSVQSMPERTPEPAQSATLSR